MGNCTGSTENPQPAQNQTRTRNPPASSAQSGQGSGQGGRGAASPSPMKGIPRSGGDPNADLINKLGTSLQDRQDAADVIKKHLADGPDADYLKHIIDETSENFIDVRSNPHHLDDQEVRERRADYQQLLAVPVKGAQLTALSLPATGNPDVLSTPVPSLDWLSEVSAAIDHAAAGIQVRKTQDIVVSFQTEIPAH